MSLLPKEISSTDRDSPFRNLQKGTLLVIKSRRRTLAMSQVQQTTMWLDLKERLETDFGRLPSSNKLLSDKKWKTLCSLELCRKLQTCLPQRPISLQKAQTCQFFLLQKHQGSHVWKLTLERESPGRGHTPVPACSTTSKLLTTQKERFWKATEVSLTLPSFQTLSLDLWCRLITRHCYPNESSTELDGCATCSIRPKTTRRSRQAPTCKQS